ncbi:hypothetical protein Nepgr_028402 [Nepenthes gracilis]|uniref:Uncharacterized protein n=1 Tax=Nepenthes gracilis TaxID=150966 RepID=A0AAD3TC64_NEPGR|nr:hypothetical protein Nepgr_028402 [Nepenthes gracilis]
MFPFDEARRCGLKMGAEDATQRCGMETRTGDEVQVDPSSNPFEVLSLTDTAEASPQVPNPVTCGATAIAKILVQVSTICNNAHSSRRIADPPNGNASIKTKSKGPERFEVQ